MPTENEVEREKASGFMEDDNGNRSMMRLLAFFAIGMAAVFGGFACFRDSSAAEYLSMFWLSAGLGSKLGQKAVESGEKILIEKIVEHKVPQ